MMSASAGVAHGVHTNAPEHCITCLTLPSSSRATVPSCPAVRRCCRWRSALSHTTSCTGFVPGRRRWNSVAFRPHDMHLAVLAVLCRPRVSWTGIPRPRNMVRECSPRASSCHCNSSAPTATVAAAEGVRSAAGTPMHLRPRRSADGTTPSMMMSWVFSGRRCISESNSLARASASHCGSGVSMIRRRRGMRGGW